MFIYSANLGSDPRPVTRGASEGFNQRTCNIRAVSYWICHVSEICSEIFGTSSYWFSLLWVDRRRIYSLFPFYWTFWFNENMGAVILLVVQCPSISRDLRESQSKESQFISRLLMHWNWNVLVIFCLYTIKF